MLIDPYLDSYATENIPIRNPDGKSYLWWWNGDTVLSDAIASLAYHIRVDGCHVLTDDEKEQLATLERYMTAYSEFDGGLIVENDVWLHAEAMWLLGQWFFTIVGLKPDLIH